jgi:hypothetical protein
MIGFLHSASPGPFASAVVALHRHRRLLRARRERPRRRRAAEQRGELAAFQSIELHSIPASQGRIAGYRISNG